MCAACTLAPPSLAVVAQVDGRDGGAPGNPVGNAAHTAPEVLAQRFVLRSGVSAEPDYRGPRTFEAGVLLCELAFSCHPLAGYPAGYIVDGRVVTGDGRACAFSPEKLRAIESAGYPPDFLPLLRECVSPTASHRPALSEVFAAVGGMFADTLAAHALEVRRPVGAGCCCCNSPGVCRCPPEKLPARLCSQRMRISSLSWPE